MPAASKSQQRLMGMVHAYKEGKLNIKSINSDLLKKIKKIASGIKKGDVKKFAKTKHKGLPELKEGKMTFKEYLIEQRETGNLDHVINNVWNNIRQEHELISPTRFATELFRYFQGTRTPLSREGVTRLMNTQDTIKELFIQQDKATEKAAKQAAKQTKTQEPENPMQARQRAS